MKSQKQNIVKKLTFILLTSSLVAMVFLTGCNSPEQKMDNAQSAVVEANRELEQTTREYQADMKQYREEAAERIAANDSTITALKAKMVNKTADVKASYEKQLAELEQKNSNMKKKLADYKGEGKEQWVNFKAEFNRDMNTLGEAFKNFTDNNS